MQAGICSRNIPDTTGGTMAVATMIDVMKYFEMKPAEFKAQWDQLTDTGKAQLKEGIGNGSLTY